VPPRYCTRTPRSAATSCASSSATARSSRASSRTSRQGSAAGTAGTARGGSGSCSTSSTFYGELAIVGRRGGQKLWDLAGRWYPETETLPLREAERRLAAHAARALGVRREKDRWLAHPDVPDGPVPDRATVLSPFDRLVYDRDRAEALWGFRYRIEIYVPAAKREYGYYVLPLLVGNELVGRVEPVVDRNAGTMRLLGAWGDTSRAGEALAPLAAFLDVELMA
jgi:uncharacterized protein YcaQ